MTMEAEFAKVKQSAEHWRQALDDAAAQYTKFKARVYELAGWASSLKTLDGVELAFKEYPSELRLVTVNPTDRSADSTLWSVKVAPNKFMCNSRSSSEDDALNTLLRELRKRYT